MKWLLQSRQRGADGRVVGALSTKRRCHVRHFCRLVTSTTSYGTRSAQALCCNLTAWQVSKLLTGSRYSIESSAIGFLHQACRNSLHSLRAYLDAAGDRANRGQ
ncbi:hypothetical protein Q31a_25240 [Aureliella helgolandensis]|uniref:Uncharacterized protein n=1 Tax=Aureliella helgolandensis TaxID=2527968 RepID=A0A518G6K1_9BACT|nr:hypothetical protein Q31a_25240 [Aureliella helgolandensis]